MRFLLVCAAGGLGTGVRYGVALAMPASTNAKSLAVVVVNLVGSFAMALVTALAIRSKISETLVPILTTGILGGFTTYSAFNQDTLAAIARGDWRWAIAYVVGTFAGCLAFGALGHVLATRI